MSNNTTLREPIFSWRFNTPQAWNVRYSYLDGATPVTGTLTLPQRGYVGYAMSTSSTFASTTMPSTTGAMDADNGLLRTLVGTLAEQIRAISDVATVTAGWVWGDGKPHWTVVVVMNSGYSSFQLDFGHATTTLPTGILTINNESDPYINPLGVKPTNTGVVDTLPSTSLSRTTLLSDFHSMGFWTPYQLVFYDDRAKMRSVSEVNSPYTGRVSRLSWGSYQMGSMSFPFVHPEQVLYHRRRDIDFFRCIVSNEDPNNVLESLLDNATTSFVYIWQKSTNDTQWSWKLVDLLGLDNTQDRLSEANGGLQYEVELPYIIYEGSDNAK